MKRFLLAALLAPCLLAPCLLAPCLLAPCLLAACLLVACSSEHAVDPPGSGAGGGGGGGTHVQTLGLNDVTMVVPMPSTPSIVLMRASDKGADGTELVPRALFDRLNNAPVPNEPLIGPVIDEVIYAELQVVAIRFDLCDRVAPEPCADSDGRLRIVFQALFPTPPVTAADAAFHAFYTIPKADLPALVAELRALAKIQNADLGSPLQASPALKASTSGEYATRLAQLVTKYAGTNSLSRLTFFAQPRTFAQVRWMFRGIEKHDGSFVDITIPGIGEPVQQVITQGMSSFEVKPIADDPQGFALVVSETDFAAAPSASQAQALGALAVSDNPLAHTPETVQCAICHLSTVLMNERAAAANMDPLSVNERYTAQGYDLSVAPLTDRTLRALGWLEGEPLISQRAANESAQVAIEMDSRF